MVYSSDAQTTRNVSLQLNNNRIMKINNTFRELQPTNKNPFEGDLLLREKPAEVLKSIIESFTESCVIALNGKWGTGKTTFIKMWEKYMENANYKVLHFNAWEDDYADDPFISLLATFNGIVGKESQVIEKTKQLLVKAGGALVSGFIKSKLGVDIKFIEDAIDKGTEGLSKIASDCIEEHNKKKETLRAFKLELERYAISVSEDRPILFVVDELDRCNPHYAIKCLERIKHLFSVDNIIFILSVDRKQLCNSIKGAYGNNDFNADDYLQRFINFTYDLPSGEMKSITEMALKRFNFIPGQYDYNAMVQILPWLCEIRNLSVRNVERLVLNVRLLIKFNQDINLPLIVLLVYFKMFVPDFYADYSKGNLETEEIISQIESLFGEKSCKKTFPAVSAEFYSAVVKMLRLNSGFDTWKEKLVDKERHIKFKVNRLDKEELEKAFETELNSYYRFDLNGVIQRIEMTYCVGI